MERFYGPLDKNPRILARNSFESHLSREAAAKKKGRRYVQPSTRARHRRNNGGEERRRLCDRFPVDRRVLPPEPTPGSFLGGCCFPLNEVCLKSFGNASDSHLRIESTYPGCARQRPSPRMHPCAEGRGTHAARELSLALRTGQTTMNGDERTKKGPTVLTTVGPQVETPKNNAARRSAGPAIVFPSTGELLRPSRPLGSFMGGCCFPLR